MSSASFSWGAFALLFAVLCFSTRLLAPNFFLQLFAPVFSVSNAVAETSHSFFNSFSDTATLAAKNEQLETENAALVSENLALAEKIASVSAFEKPVTGILAGVVSRPPESPYDTLIVNAGERAGVVLGLEAFGPPVGEASGGDVPIGRVTEVTADFSRVTLFSAPGMVTHGWVVGASVPIAIYGAGAGAMQASLSRLASVVVGDSVYAPGPGMLPIGVVARIDSDPSATNMMLRIVPRTNLFSLAWVLLRDTGTAFRNSFVTATSTAL